MVKGSVSDGLVFHAGFPNAAEDQRFDSLSIDKLVVTHRASTYFWHLESEVSELHWPAGTIVVVDRALPPKSESIVVALIDEEFTLCRIHKKGFRTLDGHEVNEQASLWGSVTYVIQAVR